MKTLKRVFRIIILIFFVALAASGAGMMGAFSPNMRERYMHKTITTEQVDKKSTEENEEDENKD